MKTVGYYTASDSTVEAGLLSMTNTTEDDEELFSRFNATPIVLHEEDSSVVIGMTVHTEDGDLRVERDEWLVRHEDGRFEVMSRWNFEEDTGYVRFEPYPEKQDPRSRFFDIEDRLAEGKVKKEDVRILLDSMHRVIRQAEVLRATMEDADHDYDGYERAEAALDALEAVLPKPKRKGRKAR